MLMGVVHTISDQTEWDESIGKFDLAALPAGFTLYSTVTAEDVSRALCVWEAPSCEDLQQLLDSAFATSAVTDCFPLAPDRSLGLPTAATGE